ncbi:MAG: polysaccharide biosynthesis tyrosine autokinase [Bacteroidota bacterium]|nr:polysaccharide biosynthesis tyrosine autokinase [Bacteroidota bacterium]
MAKAAKQNDHLDLKAFISEIIKYRWMYVFFIFFSLGIAFIINKYSSPIYIIGTKLLISSTENDRNRNISPNEFLGGLQLVQETRNIQNEIIVLQSAPLIERAIKDLNIKVSYYSKEDYLPYRYFPFQVFAKLVLREMYGNVPYEVVLCDNQAQPVGVNFYTKILNNKEFILTIDEKNVDIYDYQKDLVIRKIDKLTIQNKFRFGEIISGPDYSFKIFLNSKYDNNFENTDLYFSFQNIHDLTLNFQERLKIEQSAIEATILNMKFKGENIQKSIDFLNKLANEYFQKDLSRKNYLAKTTIEFIDQELSNISTSLNQAEGELQVFKKHNQLMNIDEKSQQMYQFLQNLENQKIELVQNLRFYNELYQYFEDNPDSPNLLAPSSMGIQDPILNNLIQQLATYNAERNSMIDKNMQRNPRFKTVTSQIMEIKKSVSKNIEFYINNTQGMLNEINSNIVLYKSQTNKLPQTQRRLIDYERSFNLNNDIYTFLLQKRAEAQIANASNLPDSEIVEPATYIGISSPKEKINYLIALILGILFPLGITTLKEILSDTIIKPSDIRAIIEYPLIGQILHNNTNKSCVISDPLSNLPIAESFRSLRTNLQFVGTDEESTILLITSSISAEGKSFIALNVAGSFSLLKKKTLLLGFDLRRPNYYSELDPEGLPGLSNYLIGKAKLDDIISGTNIPYLDLITAGNTPPNPSELIATENLGKMFSLLKGKYDYIVMDTPPMGLVTDSLLLSKYSDINIYIVRQNYTTKEILRATFQEIRDLKKIDIKFVLNDYHIINAQYDKKYLDYSKLTEKESFLRKIFSKKINKKSY